MQNSIEPYVLDLRYGADVSRDPRIGVAVLFALQLQ